MLVARWSREWLLMNVGIWCTPLSKQACRSWCWRICYRRGCYGRHEHGASRFVWRTHSHAGRLSHDLREVKFNNGTKTFYGGGVEFGEKLSEAQWRTQHSVYRNGDLYPRTASAIGHDGKHQSRQSLHATGFLFNQSARVAWAHNERRWAKPTRMPKSISNWAMW